MTTKTTTKGFQSTLKQDKVCKHVVRFAGQVGKTENLNIYLAKEDVKALGNPGAVTVTISACK